MSVCSEIWTVAQKEKKHLSAPDERRAAIIVQEV